MILESEIVESSNYAFAPSPLRRIELLSESDLFFSRPLFYYDLYVISSGILMENQPDETLEDPLADITSGSVDCFGFHQNGLFVAGKVSACLDRAFSLRLQFTCFNAYLVNISTTT